MWTYVYCAPIFFFIVLHFLSTSLLKCLFHRRSRNRRVLFMRLHIIQVEPHNAALLNARREQYTSSNESITRVSDYWSTSVNIILREALYIVGRRGRENVQLVYELECCGEDEGTWGLICRKKKKCGKKL